MYSKQKELHASPGYLVLFDLCLSLQLQDWHNLHQWQIPSWESKAETTLFLWFMDQAKVTLSDSLSLSLSLSIKPLTIFTSPHYILTVVPRSQWRARITLQSQNCNVDDHFLHPSEEWDGSAAGNFLRQAASVRETSSGGFPFFPMEVPAPFCVSCNQPKRRAQPKDGFASV